MKHNTSKHLIVILITSVLAFSTFVTPVRATTLTVTTTSDSGPGSLRQAIADATAGDTITFDSSLSGATIYVASVLVIDKEVTIDGSTLTTPITISGDSDNNGIGDGRVIYVNHLIPARFDSLIITKGNYFSGSGLVNTGFLTITNTTFLANSGENGGAISNGNTLTIINSTFSNNSATGYGGAVYNAGTLSIANSTFSANSATYGGGGIYNGSTLTVTNTTLSNNAANNNGGGAIFNADGGTLYLNNSILANSTAGADCENYPGGTIASNFSSLIETNSIHGYPCGVPALTSDPMLNALADNGGRTQTHALSIGSLAIDAGDDSICSADPVNNLDQRGMIRPQGAHCDIGSYEYEAEIDSAAPAVNDFSIASSTNSLDIPIEVFEASDNVGVTDYLITESSVQPVADDPNWSGSVPQTYTVGSDGAYTLYPWVKDAADNVSAVFAYPQSVIVSFADITVTTTADDGPGSLRQAIADATASDIIAFDNSLSGATIHLASTLNINKDLTIDGSVLVTPITISGDGDNNGVGDFRVFNVDEFVVARFESLVIANGLGDSSPYAGLGGGIHNKGILTLVSSRVSGNSTSFCGGGIYNVGTLTVLQSTFSSNLAGNGGGVCNLGKLMISNSTFATNSAGNGNGGGIRNSGPLLIVNSTFSANSAGIGGGVFNVFELTIINSTFSANSASSFGGGIYNDYIVHLKNNILANSTTGLDCYNSGNIVTEVANLIETMNTCGAPVLTSDPMLGELADNGGPTQTFAFYENSPAINAGDEAVCAADPVNSLDQRGVARFQDGHCDIGAYEYELGDDAIVPSISAFSVNSISNSLSIPISTFTAYDDLGVVGYLISVSPSQPALDDIGWTEEAPDFFTVDADGSYTLYPWVKDALGNISTAYGSPQAVAVDTTSPTVKSINRFGPDPLSSNVARFDVLFSESVTGVDISDFSPKFDVTGLQGTVSAVSSTLTPGLYVVEVFLGNGTGNGSLSLELLDNDSIMDVAGNRLGGLGVGNGDFTTGQAFTIFKRLIANSVASQDGWILESGETSNLGGSYNSGSTVFHLGDAAYREQYRSMLSFKTGSIPDNAIFTSITLKFKQSKVTGNATFSLFKGLMVDIKKGSFGSPALEYGDFGTSASEVYGPFSPTSESNWYSISIPITTTQINKLTTLNGLTQFRLRFKLDDNNNFVSNYISFFSGNASVDNQPQLIVDFYVP